MGVLNLQTGRNKLVSVSGIKELQQQINGIMDASVGKEAAAVALNAGRYVLTQMDTNARAVGVPHEVLQDLFLMGQRSGSKDGSVTVLIGLRKHGQKIPSAAYVEWSANRQQGRYEKTSRTRRKGKRLNISGTKIGENLGTMWEIGTTKMRPRPWFRKTVQAVREAVFTAMANGYKGIIERRAK